MGRDPEIGTCLTHTYNAWHGTVELLEPEMAKGVDEELDRGLKGRGRHEQRKVIDWHVEYRIVKDLSGKCTKWGNLSNVLRRSDYSLKDLREGRTHVRYLYFYSVD